jgi:hypothetical protein
MAKIFRTFSLELAVSPLQDKFATMPITLQQSRAKSEFPPEFALSILKEGTGAGTGAAFSSFGTISDSGSLLRHPSTDSALERELDLLTDLEREPDLRWPLFFSFSLMRSLAELRAKNGAAFHFSSSDLCMKKLFFVFE